jgi:DNA topoisomerase VI subunit A
MSQNEYGDMYYKLEFLIIKISEALAEDLTSFSPSNVGFAPSINRKNKYFKNDKSEYKMRTQSDRFLGLYSICLTVHRLARERKSVTKRAIYYLHPGMYKNQSIGTVIRKYKIQHYTYLNRPLENSSLPLEATVFL